MTQRSWRSVIVGTGMIGAVHARAVRAARGELQGVVASSTDRSRTVAREWGARIAYPCLAAALDDPAVDVVHICTPNADHVPQAEAALRAGKHVICEKPLGTSAESAERLAARAEAAGLVVAVPRVYRYHPIVAELRALRLAGTFGSWHLLHGSYLQDWMLPNDAHTWRLDPDRNGPSRAFADIGSHWCDLVQWVAGVRFAEVCAQTAAVRRGNTPHDRQPASDRPAEVPRHRGGGEDMAILMLRTADGVLSNLTVSQVSPGRKNRLWFELDGDAASAVFDQEAPETAWIGHVDRSCTIVRDPSRESGGRGLSFLPAGHPQGYQDCFNAFVHDSYRAMAGESIPDLPTATDDVGSARLVEAVLESAASGRWVEVGTPTTSTGRRDG